MLEIQDNAFYRGRLSTIQNAVDEIWGFWMSDTGYQEHFSMLPPQISFLREHIIMVNYLMRFWKRSKVPLPDISSNCPPWAGSNR